MDTGFLEDCLQVVLHGVGRDVDIGAETLKVVGFFPSAAIVRTYEAPIQPLGVDVLVTPDPEAAILGMRT